MEAVKDSRILFLQQKPDFSTGQATLEPSALNNSSSLLETTENLDETNESSISFVELTRITPSPYQTRQFDDSSDLSELVASIQGHGVLQPVLLRTKNEGFELVAGERRFRAAQIAGLSRIPAIISPLSDREAVEISIIENAQREDLNPIEEARAYAILSKDFSLTQADIAESVGKKRATVSNALRLLQLDPEVQELISSEQLSAGHGRALLSIESRLQQRRLARRVARSGISVRILEELIQRINERNSKPQRKNTVATAVEREKQKLQKLFGLEKVALRLSPQGQRQLTLSFDNEKAWKSFLSKIKKR